MIVDTSGIMPEGNAITTGRMNRSRFRGKPLPVKTISPNAINGICVGAFSIGISCLRGMPNDHPIRTPPNAAPARG